MNRCTYAETTRKRRCPWSILATAAFFVLSSFLVGLTGCGDSIKQARVTRLNPIPVMIQADAQGGSPQVGTSPHADVYKVSVGGSAQKKKGSSAHFIVTGGIYGGL